MRTAEIRRRFLAHFENNGHVVVPSAPLPFEDPNLLFVNAGMVQFVPYFVGQQSPPWPRATSIQKCIRTLDIDEVGKTTRHGTFFQMNGNFSFGDYFKEGAIKLAWELSTNAVDDGGFGLDGDKIWATVYLDDDEAIDIWHRVIGLPMERIVRRGKADNFWSMGIPGPCGPCSELYIDRGPDHGAEGGPEVDEDRYMEFWNLVFMQNERGATDGPNAKENFPILGELPAENIDTGMGMERMAALLQGVDNLYEIDETRPILDRAAALSGKVYGAHSGHAASQSHPDDVRLRVIADHVRTGLMLIGDGVTPSNEGRGYVLRRVLRRAIRSMRLLGYDDPALPELLPVARDCMAPSYPELATDFDRISQYAYAEEETFRATLRSGTAIFEAAVGDVRRAGGTRLPGDKAFQLHDTYGFPIDLTLEMAAEQGVSVDEAEFRRLMAEQRAKAKADSQAKKTAHVDLSVYREALARGASEFTGYREVAREAVVLALIGPDGLLPSAGEGDEVEIVLDATPFYAEGGGQQADRGRLTVNAAGREAQITVLDVQSPLPGVIAHHATVLSGEVRPGDVVLAQVSVDRRAAISRSHSATHLVHAGLRRALGETAAQAGSLNAPGRLRFDFTTPSAVPASVLGEIEDEINEVLLRDLEVRWFVTDQAEAKRIGAIAMFGEKYGDEVRVVEIGDYSRELCGGTHVTRSSVIGMIKLMSEASIGAGVRRVDALVGLDAFRHLAREHVLVSQLAADFRAQPEELPERIAHTLERLRGAERELDRLRASAVLSSAGTLAEQAEQLGAVQLVAATAPAGVNGNDLRALALDVRNRLRHADPGVVLLASPVDDGAGAAFVVAVNDAGQAGGLAAGELARVFAPVLGARGGGKADLAQGAGGDVAKLEDAFGAVRAALQQ